MSKSLRMMPIRKVLLILCLFVVSLFAIRAAWYSLMMKPDPSVPKAVQGVLDLRNWSFSEDQITVLNGEWEFFPSQLLPSNVVDKTGPVPPATTIQVPGTWNETLNPKNHSPYGYGTYRLRVLVTPDPSRSYGMYVPSLRSASKVYVNGQLLASSGEPAAEARLYSARTIPYSLMFTSDRNEIDIELQVANYDHYREGGIIRSIKFGSYPAIEKEKWFSVSMQIIVCAVLAMHAIYACILYVIGMRQKAFLPFLLLIVSATVMTLADDDKLLLQWLTFDYSWSVRLVFLAYIAVAAFLLHFAKQLLPEGSRRKTAYRVVTWLCILSAGVVIFSSANWVFKLGIVYFLLPFVVCVMLLIRSVRTAVTEDEDALFLALGMTGITTNVLGALFRTRFWPDMGYYPIDLIVTFLMFASFWFKRYFHATAQSVELASKLQAADRAKDLFLANTSHELRNPLHGMINIAQSILETPDRDRDGKERENLELLISVGKRMSFLVNDLLDMARLRENGIRLHVRELKIQAVAPGVTDMLRFMLSGKNIRLVNTIPDTFPAVLADEIRLTQILFNLLHNAVKYTVEGSITLHASMEADKAHICVTDTGIGMDAETKRRIFLPYEQGDPDTTAVSGGIGLGLSITKQLVELHAGTLEVRSTPGSGSQFCFTLPLARSVHELSSDAPWQEAPAGSAEAAASSIDRLKTAAYASTDLSEAAAASEPLRHVAPEPTDSLASELPNILAIDDDPINLSILVNLLSTQRYRIVTASSGKEALALLDSREWDLVISDVMMPGISGYELTRQIRERFTLSELPILLLTARSQPEDIEAGFRSGANDYVTKPVDAQELRSRVQSLTEMKRSARERLRMEAAWLQAQIQPHFLFNTLNSIAALQLVNPDRMSGLLDAFGNYLRMSFDFHNSERLVPLSYELDLVRSYLYIEKERFEDRLDIRWEIDEVPGLRLPPLSIQPLVENAVRHGVLKRRSGGTICIRIKNRGDRTEIAVIDDGVGMNEETRLALLSQRQHAKRSGIGLINTDRRLRQGYGEGLLIESAPDLGTTVRFFVPSND